MTTIFEKIHENKGKLAHLLEGTGLTVDKLASSFIMALKKNKELLACNEVSVLQAFSKCAEIGLAPINENVVLTPFKGECKVTVGYHGWLTLLWRTKKVKNILSYPVHEEDFFDVDLGCDPYIKHKPKLNTVSKLMGTYGIVKLTNGEVQIKICGINEIEASKKASQGSSSPFSPWNKYYEQMAQIVPIRKLAKTLAISIRDAETETEEEEGIEKPILPAIEEKQPLQIYPDLPPLIEQTNTLTVDTDAQMLKEEELAIREGS